MRLLKINLLAMMCFFASVYSGFLLANNDLVSSELESLVTAYNVAVSKDSESIEDLMKTMHPESPDIVGTKTMAEGVFLIVDMDASTIEFHFIGLSGDYALARAKVKMEKISGPASFKSHVSEYFYVFKKDQEKWKNWRGAILSMDFL